MTNDKKWEKPEITILFSGNVDEHVTVGGWSPPAQEDTGDPSEYED